MNIKLIQDGCKSEFAWQKYTQNVSRANILLKMFEKTLKYAIKDMKLEDLAHTLFGVEGIQ